MFTVTNPRQAGSPSAVVTKYRCDNPIIDFCDGNIAVASGKTVRTQRSFLEFGTTVIVL